MFDISNSFFKKQISIPTDSQIIFVSDLFADEYVGGAELTSQALIDSSPFKVFKLKSKSVTIDLLRQGADKFWIFGNFSEMTPELIPSIIGNLKYSVLEYDYKYCKYRSPEKHMQTEGLPCDCHNQMNGKLISAFYYGAMGTWWMSEKQRERYVMLFPFLAEKDSVILSSVFDSHTLGYIESLRTHNEHKKNDTWIVLGSNSWVKGAKEAVEWCKTNNYNYEVVWNVDYHKLLEKLSLCKGFVYLPKGGDTCPRMVIEAKLLGCTLHINENVQHTQEEWFASNNLNDIKEHLFASRDIFWKGIKKMMDFKPSISGYVTTYNCVTQKYPLEACVKSMLEFCDEVCIVDGGSTDETLTLISKLLHSGTEYAEDQMSIDGVAQMLSQDSFEQTSKDKKIRAKVVKRDWSAPNFAVFDGMQKAEARAMCSKDFCWQMDSDEIVHEDDARRILDICRSMPGDANIIALPVIEYWGGPEKVRLDVQPWKWRLSRNHHDITHGIPVNLRKIGEDGLVYAKQGTDGCDMISKETGEPVPFLSFYTSDVEAARQAALAGNEQARSEYEQWFNMASTGLPGVFHYSWYDLERKIKLYRDYWTSHWVQLSGETYVDTEESNMMFDVPWSKVTDQMITDRAKELKQTGGHIWHSKWNGQMTPHIKSTRTQPKFISGFFK